MPTVTGGGAGCQGIRGVGWGEGRGDLDLKPLTHVACNLQAIDLRLDV